MTRISAEFSGAFHIFCGGHFEDWSNRAIRFPKIIARSALTKSAGSSRLHWAKIRDKAACGANESKRRIEPSLVVRAVSGAIRSAKFRDPATVCVRATAARGSSQAVETIASMFIVTVAGKT